MDETTIEYPQAMTIASTDSVEIAYTKYSDGQHALVLVHGWSCDQSYWKEQIDAFDDDYQVVTVDIGGHGASGSGNRSDWTIPSFAQDVKAVIDELEYEELTLVGHSLGTMVVLETGKLLNDESVAIVGVDYLKDKLVALPREAVEGYMQPFHADFENSMKGFVSAMFTADADSAFQMQIMNDMASGPAEVAIPASIDLATRNYDATFEAIQNNPKYIINTD
ncbi:MAG: alpha/beta hydrolase, partial [Bacteroidota bacterium]